MKEDITPAAVFTLWREERNGEENQSLRRTTENNGPHPSKNKEN